MTEYSKYNIVYRLQKWLDSVPGQTFLNYAYSWGASIVILGTLFKLTHLPGANIMLYLGMGTEVIVFFISAFDRPFDKTAIGKDLPTHVGEDEPEDEDLEAEEAPQAGQTEQDGVALQPGMAAYVGPVVGQAVQGTQAGSQPEAVQAAATEDGVNAAVQSGQPVVAGQAVPAWVSAQQQVSPEMEEATNDYVTELRNLTDMLAKVAEQSARLTRDSEEMENLNRTLTGICKVYEMQLKGASAQIGTIDEINEQSRKMASQIEQLNKIYARMIEAMTVNMRATAAGGSDSKA